MLPCLLSTASTIVFKAVSNPMVKSVPNKSLSIVPGAPIKGILYSNSN